VVLPECFNSPYDTKSFPRYAEPIPAKRADIDEKSSPSIRMLSDIAKELQVIFSELTEAITKLGPPRWWQYS